LERKQAQLLDLGVEISSSRKKVLSNDTASTSPGALLNTANTLFRKGDAWSINLSRTNNSNSNSKSETALHHLKLTRVLRNEFPTSLSAEILFTSPTSSTPYTLTFSSTSASASAATSQHRRGNPSDPSHISIPFPGKLVEVLVDEGDVIKEGDVLCVVQQMKMELEVRAHRSGMVSWVLEVEDGEDVAEGMLVAVIERDGEARL
jgi:biotin carboxyl carrier protein